MAWVLYDTFIRNQLNGAEPIDFDTDTIKCILLTNSYVPAEATHDYRDDLGANEVATGSTYAAGGPALANKTLTLAAGVVKFDADDVVIAQDATGFTNARYAVLYKAKGGLASADPLIGYANLGADKSIQGGSLTLQFDATSGIFTAQ